MPAVKYSGPWAEASGYAQANRNIISSLYESGVDVVTELQTYSNNPTDYGKQLELAKSLQNKHNDYAIKVLHITPNVYIKHKELYKYHIGHLFWETTKMSPHWSWYLNEVREIWTGCKVNADTFKASGFNGKIFTFPQPLDVTRTASPLPIDNVRGFVFCSIFQWIERKNPEALLTAYWTEFQDNRDVTLVIKTYGLGFEKHETERVYNEIAAIKKKLNLPHYPNTLVIDYLLTDDEVHSLYESVDCVVTPHRFEGWGVVQSEALVHGKPLISTPLGGIHEWLSDKAYYPIKYTMTDVFNMDWAEQYTVPGNKWASVDIADLRKQMRSVYENREEAKKTGKQGQKEVREKLNYKTVGAMMKKRIEEIYKEEHL
jgi:glycosyltransferase involved in cell wall biosynthesis